MIARPGAEDQPTSRRARAGIDGYRDQLFWAESAIAPLVGLMLDADKADSQATAVLALVKLGEPAVPRVTPLLAERRSRAMAAIILGTIDRPEAEADPPSDVPARRARGMSQGKSARLAA